MFTRTSHLTFAHSVWKKHIKSESHVIDATCGNGYDSHFILQCNPAHLYCLDIQKKALKNTRNRLEGFKQFSLHQACHSTFSMVEKPIDLIVYNLGYLPGGNKSLTTQTETTLLSLSNALNLLRKNGLTSIMLYPGHLEGMREKEALLCYVSNLPRKKFQVHLHRWLSHSNTPALLLIQKTA